MKTEKIDVPGGFIYVFETDQGITSTFVPLGKNTLAKGQSQSAQILKLLKETQAGMTPESVAAALSYPLLSVRQLLSKLKSKNLIDKIGIEYKVK